VQVIINGLVIGHTYILIALGLAIVFSIGGVLNFAHGGLCVLGGFFLYALFQQLGLNFLVAFLLASIGVAVVAVIIERLLVRRLAGQLHAIVIVMLGLTLILSGGSILVFGEQDKVIQPPFKGVLSIADIHISNEKLLIVEISVVLILALVIFLKKTTVGQALRAVGQDSEAAAIVGVNTLQYSTISFAIGGFLAGAAGSIVGVVFLVSPTADMFFVIKGITIIMIGGLGSMGGIVLAGLLVGVLESFTLTFIGAGSELITFTILIIIILFRPRGLFGHEE